MKYWCVDSYIINSYDHKRQWHATSPEYVLFEGPPRSIHDGGALWYECRPAEVALALANVFNVPVMSKAHSDELTALIDRQRADLEPYPTSEGFPRVYLRCDERGWSWRTVSPMPDDPAGIKIGLGTVGGGRGGPVTVTNEALSNKEFYSVPGNVPFQKERKLLESIPKTPTIRFNNRSCG